MSRRALTDEEVADLLVTRPRWTVRDGTLTATYAVPFETGAAYVAAVAVWTSVVDHHPDVTVTYHATTVRVATHDRPHFTTWDRDLVHFTETWFRVSGL